MKKPISLLSLLIVLTIASCSLTKRSVTADTMKIVKTDVVTKPQIADLQIENKKIEGKAEVRKKDYFPNPKEACINLALKDAIIKGNCDLIVQPMYEVEEDKVYVRVKVIGFAASYKKFRDLQEADTNAFKAYSKISSVINVDVAAPKSDNLIQSQTKKGRGKGAVVILLLLLGSLVVGAVV